MIKKVDGREIIGGNGIEEILKGDMRKGEVNIGKKSMFKEDIEEVVIIEGRFDIVGDGEDKEIGEEDEGKGEEE